MLKKIVKHGNVFAVPIDKKTMQEAKLNQNSKFEIQVIPGGGLLIQSVEEIDREKLRNEFDSITQKYDKLFKKLSKK